MKGQSMKGQGTKARVLVVEDDPDISLSIRTVLTRSGFDVTTSDDGKEGLRAFHAARPDLVILDIGLPALDGWSVLERIRDMSDVPVLMLTAHGREADKVRGLNLGADDYLTKPFGNGELAARVEALLRRPRSGQPEAEVYDDGSLLLRLDTREVSVGGTPVALTPTEYRLLVALVRHQGQTLAPEQLLELAWNDPLGIGPERVKFAIMRLRRKLGMDAERPAAARRPGGAIEAVRGFGYRYVPPRTRLAGCLAPLRSCTGAATARGRPAGQIAPMNAAARRGRILVVEDDPDAALFAVYVLANRGRFHVRHTAEPAAALRMAAAEPWDLVLTEAVLPGMTGLELLRALRRVAPGLPVAVVTGYVLAEEASAELRSLADEYLIKPVRAGRLIETAAALSLKAAAARRGNLRG
jgi:DNA-binding response OmpR family regulator